MIMGGSGGLEINKPPNRTSEDRGKEVRSWINKVNIIYINIIRVLLTLLTALHSQMKRRIHLFCMKD